MGQMGQMAGGWATATWMESRRSHQDPTLRHRHFSRSLPLRGGRVFRESGRVAMEIKPWCTTLVLMVHRTAGTSSIEQGGKDQGHRDQVTPSESTILPRFPGLSSCSCRGRLQDPPQNSRVQCPVSRPQKAKYAQWLLSPNYVPEPPDP